MLKKLNLYYILIALPYVMVLAGAAIFFDAIKTTILRNPHPQINYTIFVIILGGGIFILLNARRLIREGQILKLFITAIPRTDLATLQEMTQRFRGDIAALLQMLASSRQRTITHQEQRAIEHELANSRTLLNRRNALPQYLTGLLVGMGLVGTFIGLLSTLNDISILITSFADIDMNVANPIEVFGTMIERMKAPMSSMGIAFSASLFGLLGSIILGLMMVGIRRLESDVFSTLSSEVARHIENALAMRGAEEEEAASGSDKILLRIEERLAESARLQQRSLSSEIDDFNKQRADMLRALTDQTEAHNNFRSELQQLGRQLGSIFNVMEKDNGELAIRIPERAVEMTGDTEGSGIPQTDVLRAFTDSNNNFRRELHQLGNQLETISNVMEKGNDEVCNQVSELKIHMSADAKQSQIMLNTATSDFRSQFGTIISNLEKGTGELTSQVAELAVNMAGDAKDSHEQRDEMLRTLAEQIEENNKSRSELQQLGSQLDGISNVMAQGNSELASQITELMAHVKGDGKESHDQRDKMLRKLSEQIVASNSFNSEIQQLGSQLESQLASIASGMDKSTSELAGQVTELMAHVKGDGKESHDQRDEILRTLSEQVAASNNFNSEIQQLGSQLESQLNSISNGMDNGASQLASQITELMSHVKGDGKGSHEQRDEILRTLSEQGAASNNFNSEIQQLGSKIEGKLNSISNGIDNGASELASQIIELMVNVTGDAKKSHEQRDEISNRIYELMVHMIDNAKKSHKLLAPKEDEQL